ncbi:hypothetical protein SORBI_3002G234000 [Sorghum bicolor]|uniref:Uncharacterized protein n=1 Tax=Sorghum bicolor TaxID=4558 RepID=A0A1B6QD42_SORBI|nr:hypothetical protein SORBI_3002G234000 [Sorghum bicolor]
MCLPALRRHTLIGHGTNKKRWTERERGTARRDGWRGRVFCNLNRHGHIDTWRWRGRFWTFSRAQELD